MAKRRGQYAATGLQTGTMAKTPPQGKLRGEWHALSQGNIRIERRPKWLFKELGLRGIASTVVIEEIAMLVYAAVGKRVGNDGRGDTNQRFPAYTEQGYDPQTKEGRPFWVPWGHPQPDGFLFRGKKGWKGYKSRAEYERLKGEDPNLKRFIMSGAMWQGFKIAILSPTRARIQFTGTSRSRSGRGERVRNRDKAVWSGRSAGQDNILMPSVADVSLVEQYVADYLNYAVLNDINEAAHDFEWKKRALGHRNRMQRNLRKMRKYIKEAKAIM